MKKEPKRTSCFSCVYWSIYVAAAYDGECRIKAPSITNNQRWPKTSYYEGCGEGVIASEDKLQRRERIIDAYEKRNNSDNEL